MATRTSDDACAGRRRPCSECLGDRNPQFEPGDMIQIHSSVVTAGDTNVYTNQLLPCKCQRDAAFASTGLALVTCMFVQWTRRLWPDSWAKRCNSSMYRARMLSTVSRPAWHSMPVPWWIGYLPRTGTNGIPKRPTFGAIATRKRSHIQDLYALKRQNKGRHARSSDGTQTGTSVQFCCIASRMTPSRTRTNTSEPSWSSVAWHISSAPPG